MSALDKTVQDKILAKNPEYATMLKALYAKQNADAAKIRKEAKSLDQLTIELAVGRVDGGISVILPVVAKDLKKELGIAKALYEHVKSALVQSAGEGNVGKTTCGPYLGFVAKTGAVQLSTPKLFVDAQISIDTVALPGKYCAGTAPQTACVPQPVSGSETITLQHSDIKYGILLIKKATSKFFPPYSEKFILSTPLGETTAWVTSRPKGNNGSGRGNYIVGCLKKLYTQLNVKEGDQVVIDKLPQRDGKNVYRLMVK